jgi:hypothetical protein
MPPRITFLRIGSCHRWNWWREECHHFLQKEEKS